MSFTEKRRVLVKTGGDAEIIGLARSTVGLLSESNKPMPVKLEGRDATVASVLESQAFDDVEFTFALSSEQAFAAYVELLRAVDAAGAGRGALVSYDSDFSSRIEAYGDFTCEGIHPDACDAEWMTGALFSVVIKADVSEMRRIMECEGEEDDLENALEEDGGRLVAALIGDDLAAKILRGATEALDVDFDAGTAEFGPDSEWCYGTMADFAHRKDLFECAAAAAQTKGAVIAFYWADEGGSRKDANTLVSKQGFMSLKFETAPNRWGDFKILRYILK